MPLNVVVSLLCLGPVCTTARADDFHATITADWAAQEQRYGRSPQDAQAIAEALRRAQALSQNLRSMAQRVDIDGELAQIETLRTQAGGGTDETAGRDLYHKIRATCGAWR
jgi:phytoene dehydrogenase-like protein